jgi:hypothetical protein
MFDSVTPQDIPRTAQAVAGYVGGSWPTYGQLHALFPSAKLVSIAVSATEDADFLDVENGDASTNDPYSWIMRQLAAGRHRPGIYANMSTMPIIVHNLTGIPRSKYRLWEAHYIDARPAIVPSGIDALQWWSQATEGANYDISLCADDFFS